MVCAAAIAIAITVTTSPILNLGFSGTVSGKAKISVSDDGDLHFRKAKDCVDVSMSMTGGTFAQNPLGYADDPDGTYNSVPSNSNSGQISNLQATSTSLSFTYTNSDMDCGKKYRYSGYIIYLIDANGKPQEWDPIVTNGGNDLIPLCSTSHHRPRYRGRR